MKSQQHVSNIRSVDLNLLAIFDAVYRERNITRAAKRLEVSQPAVSGALNRLRRLLGDPLFVKTNRGMEPTTRADDLAEPVALALDAILDALNQNSGFDFAHTRHSFRLAMSDYSEFLMLPPLMQWLRANAPGISLTTVPVVEETLPADLEAGVIDLAIGNIPSLQARCYRQGLISEGFVCVVRDTHPEVGEQITLRQFEHIPQVSFTPRKAETTLDEALAKQGLKRHIALKIPNYLALMAIVAATDLVGILPVRIAERLRHISNLRVVAPPVDFPHVAVSQHWHVRNNNNPANKWLRGLLKELTAEI